MEHINSSADIQQQDKEGVGDEGNQEKEDIQTNIKNISKSGDISPRSVTELKKERRKGRPIGTKHSQIQTRSSSAKPTGSK